MWGRQTFTPTFTPPSSCYDVAKNGWTVTPIRASIVSVSRGVQSAASRSASPDDAMTDSSRHIHHDPRPEPEGAPPFDDWEELFEALEERAVPDPLDEPPDGEALARRLAAWSILDREVEAVGWDLPLELALAASCHRPSPLLSAVGRLVDADPVDSCGRDVYLAAFRRPLVLLSFCLARRSASDAMSWRKALEDDLLAATHELVVFGTVFSGHTVVERTRQLAFARLAGKQGQHRLLVSCLAARAREALEGLVRDLCAPDLVDRVLQRLVPLSMLQRLQALIDDGVEFAAACRVLRIRRFAARRQLAGYRTVLPLYRSEAARLAGQMAALEKGGEL
jgi:hypothetical protein